MNWIGRWLLVTGILSLSSLLAALLFERAFTEAADVLLAPWFALCRALTPIEWQARGNILLGMRWLFTGVALYSMLIGAVYYLITGQPPPKFSIF